jgi:hypothetical protein
MFGFRARLAKAIGSLRLGCTLLLVAASSIAAAAEPMLPQGSKTISLVAADGTHQKIGHVNFTPDGDASKFDVLLDAPEFGDEFLSMRPFRCLADVKEMWCHLAYPYDLEKRITSADLTDLEYALLFLFKPPAGYGIDAWNGLYFKLALTGDGNITGKLNEADFNVLASPPEAKNLRPLADAGLTPVSTGHRFTGIEIK